MTWRLPKGTTDTTHFEYTVDGQMVKAYNDDIERRFAYDGIGNRIRKIIIENSDTTVVKYAYDGADLLFEKDNNDAVQIRYLYGPGIDHILESVDSVGTKQHFADALGSVTRITDSTGARYKHMVYSSYGVLSTDSGSVQADYVSYTGREAERDLGIYFYRSRFYDPLPGRFLTRDQIGFFGGDINLFRYAGNNPINFIDPFGWVRIKRGVSDSTLRDEIRDRYGVIDSVFAAHNLREATITSTNRDYSGHREGSLHYSDFAIDIRGNDLSDALMRQMASELQRALGPDFDVLAEFRTNPDWDHIHIEYDPETSERETQDVVTGDCVNRR